MPTAIPTTQRAYTFRIKRSPETDAALTRTHASVNAGAAVALDWMLSFAGGLNAARGIDPAARMMLTRCWLSVESRDGAPAEHIVSSASTPAGTQWHTEAALDAILADEGFDEASRSSWIEEVRTAINASLREDAVWVNRRAAFAECVRRVGAISQTDIDDFFFDSGWFERDRFFAIDVEAEAPECMRAMNQWLSRRFGTGTGANFAAISVAYRELGVALDAMAAWPTASELHAWLCAQTFAPDDSLAAIVSKARERVVQTTAAPDSREPSREFAELTPLEFAAAFSATEFQLLAERWQSEHPGTLSAAFERGGITADDLAAELAPLAQCGTSASPLAVSDALDARVTGPGHKSRTKTLLIRALAGTEAPLDRAAFERLRAAAHSDAATCAAKPPKGPLPYASGFLAAVEAACGFSYAGKPARHAPYSIMFDLAGRRFAGALSAIRNAECDRAEYDLPRLAAAVPPAVMQWCERYSQTEGAIRPRGVTCWTEVFERWATCADSFERVAAVRSVQDERNREFGNANLFLEIATDGDAEPVRETAEALLAYVQYSEARTAVARRKAPMIHHIHELHSPVWAEFGDSRFAISLEPTATGARLTLGVIGSSGLDRIEVVASGARFAEDIGRHVGTAGTGVSRGDRLGRLAADAGSAAVSLIAPMKWNGKIHFGRKYVKGERRWLFTFSAPLAVRKPEERVLNVLKDNRVKNTSRGNAVRLNLGRTPGIRILGVNTGLRAGAACAVLETISSEEMAAVAAAAGVAGPGPDDFSFVVPTPPGVNRHRAANAAVAASWRGLRYRRIGDDVLPNGQPHPSPWARIEETFVVRLPGELRNDIRRATPTEVSLVQEIALRLRIHTQIAERVTDLQRNALRTVRRALSAQGRLATAAFVLSQYSFSGGVSAERAATALGRLEKLAVLDTELAAILANHPIDFAQAPEHARSLVGQLHALWTERDPAVQAALGRMRAWLLPSAEQHTHGVGGLSLDRLGNLKSLRSAHVAFAMRPHTIAARAREELDRNYGAFCLDVIARLRKERTRRLASRVIEAALGGPRDSNNKDSRSAERTHAPVQAIVMEDLRGFRTDQSRTRRENVTLMTWAHAELRDLIEQGCKLHGIPLRTVVAAYTSQEDGRDGSAGIRVRRMAVDTFVEAPWSIKEIEKAMARRNRKVETEVDRLMLAWWSRWDPESGRWQDEYGRMWTRRERRWVSHAGQEKTPPPIVLPDPEGPLFASLMSLNPVSADTNAAITIASKVVLDPDWAGSYSHIAVQRGQALEPRVKGGALFRTAGQRALMIDTASESIINAWRHRSRLPMNEGQWYTAGAYFAMVRNDIARQLRERLETRAAA